MTMRSTHSENLVIFRFGVFGISGLGISVALFGRLVVDYEFCHEAFVTVVESVIRCMTILTVAVVFVIDAGC